MMPTTQHETLARLATDILIEAQKLVGQEFVAAKEELAPNWVRAKRVACYLFLTAIVSPAFVVVLSLMLAHLLAASTAVEPWVCELIVVTVLATAGGAFLALALFHSKQIDFIPRNTLDIFKENMQCLKNRV